MHLFCISHKIHQILVNDIEKLKCKRFFIFNAQGKNDFLSDLTYIQIMHYIKALEKIKFLHESTHIFNVLI